MLSCGSCASALPRSCGVRAPCCTLRRGRVAPTADGGGVRFGYHAYGCDESIVSLSLAREIAPEIEHALESDLAAPGRDRGVIVDATIYNQGLRVLRAPNQDGSAAYTPLAVVTLDDGVVRLGDLPAGDPRACPLWFPRRARCRTSTLMPVQRPSQMALQGSDVRGRARGGPGRTGRERGRQG